MALSKREARSWTCERKLADPLALDHGDLWHCEGLDHCPIIVNSDPSREKRKKIFHFEVFWAKEEGCRELVERSWCRRGGGRGDCCPYVSAGASPRGLGVER
ncbi:hypothetical protein ACFX1Q_006157 [Malus domestica]